MARGGSKAPAARGGVTGVAVGLHKKRHTQAERSAETRERVARAATECIGELGFSGATIQIFDVTGRRVVSDEFSGSFTWNAADVPSGAYFAVVSDGVTTSTAKLTKIF